MKARLIQIGNSRGIRLPKPVIEEAGLDDEVQLQVRKGAIVIRPLRAPRSGWAQAARVLRENAGDRLVVSPDELNAHLRTFIVAPMTTGDHIYPFRVSCRFRGRTGHVVADQTRTVDRERLVRRLGSLSPTVLNQTLSVLQEMFSP
jgi:mRNA interferase MazF